MERKKVIFCLIQAFSPEERLYFKKKIPCSKSSKTAERISKLFEYFEKLVLLEGGFDAIDPRKIGDMLNLSSHKKICPFYDELVTDLQDFLIKKSLEKNFLEKQILLQNALIERDENIYIHELHSEIRQHVANTLLPLPEEYFHRSSFYNSLYTHISTDTYQPEALLYLHQSESNLDISYWIQKLRILIEKATRAITLSDEEFILKELPTLPDLTAYTQHNEIHVLSIYIHIYQFALTPFQSKDLDHIIDLVKSASSIPKEDSERIFNYLNNIVIYYISNKNLNIYNLSPKDIYKVYKLGFCNLWLVQKDGRMLFEDFINILSLAFHNKDFEFLESISDDYQEFILNGYALFVEMLAKGYNFFLHQKWAAVIKAFSNQDSPPKPYKLHYILQRNVLEIKAILESLIQDKKELDDIANALEKHYRFAQREFKINDSGKNRNINFIKILRKIHPYLNKRISFQLDSKTATKEVQDWIQEVEALNGKTIEYSWLQSIGERLLAEVQKTAVKSL